VALKAITLRLDEEEYEKLKAHLSKFGDPDINVAYVLRSYIRDLNRVLPFAVNAGWDLKNYFGFLGIWLKQFVSMSDTEMFSKGMFNWWESLYPGGRGPKRSGGSGSEESGDDEAK
jgi:hypothetical protein